MKGQSVHNLRNNKGGKGRGKGRRSASFSLQEQIFERQSHAELSERVSNLIMYGMVWYGLFNRIIKHGYNKYI
jgi:hypothetical protein